MSLVKVSGNASGSGTLTIAAPNTNSDYTLTLPTNTGTLISTKSAGTVLQVVSTIKQDTFSMSGASFVEITGLTATITPTTTSNKVLVQVSLGRVGPNIAVGATVAFQLLRGATVIGAGTPSGSQLASSFVATSNANGNYSCGGFAFQFLDSPSTTSATTYSVKMLAESSTTAYINRSFTGGTTAATYDAASSSTITVMEIAA